MPQHVRTGARCRQTPVLRVPLTRDQRAAIGASTGDGRVFMPTPTGADHRADGVRFRRLLLRTIRGKLRIIWEGTPLHRGQPLTEFLARGAARRRHLEHLPGYAPARTPVAGSWNSLQWREVGTVCCREFVELDTALRRAKDRLRHKRSVVYGGLTECGYHI